MPWEGSWAVPEAGKGLHPKVIQWDAVIPQRDGTKPDLSSIILFFIYFPFLESMKSGFFGCFSPLHTQLQAVRGR